MGTKRSLRPASLLLPAFLLFCAAACEIDGEKELPNIVYILADDLGYGDVSAFNPDAAWETIHMDRIAAEGMMFTDAHTNSAVCSPTRYGILTGRYAWRTRLKNGVLWSWDAPLIGPTEMTVGRMLQGKGYTTACIGKWHLGLGWQFHRDYPDSVDFSKPVSGGPLTAGFDYFFGITASLDIPPYVYIENDLATVVPTRYTESTSDMGWWRRGLTGDDFDHEQVLPVLTDKAVKFINNHVQTEDGKPFFLYFPLPAPHTPIIPTPEFQGKSGTNPYGDFVLQVDWTVGRILEALDNMGIGEKTMVIFTSDNGCSPQAGFEQLADFGHHPGYLFRGAKADIYEGGHRVPFAIRWPGKIAKGSSSSQVICHTDLMATLAAVTGYSPGPEEAVDSYNLLPVLLDQGQEEVREATIHHSIDGSFAIRKGKWKLIMCPGSGGWSYPRPGTEEESGLPPRQLFDLERDIEETENLVDQFPNIALQLQAMVEQYIVRGRSTPGADQPFVRADRWPGLEWMNNGKDTQ